MRKLLILLLALAAPAAPGAWSAEIEILDPRPIGFDRIAAGECTLRLKGSITGSEAAQITRAIEEERLIPIRSTDLFINFPNGLPVGHALCLESGGGSLPGGIALARTLIENAIATVVEPGKDCLSACAVAFMAGTMGSSNSDGGSRIPYRVMDITARLGFHAPYVDFSPLVKPGKPLPPGVLDEAFRSALETTALIAETLQGQDLFAPTERFPRALLLAMLGTYGADRFSFVDTLDEAGLYDIKLTGLPEIGLDDGSWTRLCANLTGWAAGRRTSVWDPDLPSWTYQVIGPEGEPDPETPLPEMLLRQDWADDAPEPDPAAFFRQVNSRHEHCTVYAHPGAGDDYSIYFRANGEQLQTAFRSADPWQTLPAATPFSALIGRTEVPAGALRTLYPRDGSHADAATAPPLPPFAPGQLWAFYDPSEDESLPFDLIHLGADGRARLARSLPPDASERGAELPPVPYRLTEGALCLETTAPLCLTLEDPGGREPTLRRSDRAGDVAALPVLYMRPDLDIDLQ